MLLKIPRQYSDDKNDNPNIQVFIKLRYTIQFYFYLKFAIHI